MRFFRLLVRAGGRRLAPLWAAASRLEAQIVARAAQFIEARRLGAGLREPVSMQARLVAAERMMDRWLDRAERGLRQAPQHARALAARVRTEGVRALGPRPAHWRQPRPRVRMQAVRRALRGVMRPRSARPMLLSVAAASAAGLLLAAFAPVERVAIGSGFITDEGASFAVSHPEGGMIAHIMVRPGQEVSAGDLLMRLEPRAAAGDATALRLRAARLAMAKARLSALMDGDDEPSFSSDAELDPQRARIEADLFRTERTRNLRALRVLDEAARDARMTIAALQERAVKLDDLQAHMMQRLASSNRPNAPMIADASLMRLRAERALVERDLATARKRLGAAEVERTEKMADRRREWSSELSRVAAELDALDAAMLRFVDRAADFEVRAPAGGRVQWVTARASQFARPNEALVRILPSDAELLAEVWAPASEVRAVRAGDVARVRLDVVSAPDKDVIGGIVKALGPEPEQRLAAGALRRVIVALAPPSDAGADIMQRFEPGAGVRAEIVVTSAPAITQVAGLFAGPAMARQRSDNVGAGSLAESGSGE